MTASSAVARRLAELARSTHWTKTATSVTSTIETEAGTVVVEIALGRHEVRTTIAGTTLTYYPWPGGWERSLARVFSSETT
jgi:hypothetical protein